MRVESWWLWYWDWKDCSLGIDLANWGLGFMISFRWPNRGTCFNVGPFYITTPL